MKCYAGGDIRDDVGTDLRARGYQVVDGEKGPSGTLLVECKLENDAGWGGNTFETYVYPGRPFVRVRTKLVDQDTGALLGELVTTQLLYAHPGTYYSDIKQLHVSVAAEIAATIDSKIKADDGRK